MSGFAVAPQSQSDGGPYEGQEDQGNTTMPWTAKNFAARHNHKATPSQAKKAAAQATAMVNSGVDEHFIPMRAAVAAAGRRRARAGPSYHRANGDTRH